MTETPNPLSFPQPISSWKCFRPLLEFTGQWFCLSPRCCLKPYVDGPGTTFLDSTPHFSPVHPNWSSECNVHLIHTLPLTHTFHKTPLQHSSFTAYLAASQGTQRWSVLWRFLSDLLPSWISCFWIIFSIGAPVLTDSDVYQMSFGPLYVRPPGTVHWGP